ncbi:MAG TPA: hypothetical protein VEP49_14175 [Acidimicrobiia bacterium]|nr:hypothetical protein [Acidimicrobiia bacterium]
MSLLEAGATAHLGHALADDPLLSLDALADAADRLPPELVMCRPGDLPRLLPEHATVAVDGRPGDIARAVASNGWWVRLASLVPLPEYAALLPRAAGQFELMLRARGERILAHDLQAFVAAPGTTVPLHFDRDHQLLVQIRGSKTVGIGRYARDGVARRQLARGFADPPMRPDVEPDIYEARRLGPGDALFIAAATFHWVENGADDVSIALVCVARTERTEREAARLRLDAARIGGSVSADEEGAR